MKLNKNLILGTILLLLLVFAYVQQGPLKTWKNNSGKATNFLTDIDAMQIVKIEISSSGETVFLEKEKERWKVGGAKDFYVQSIVADKLDSALSKLSTTELDVVSRNRDNKNKFGVDELGTKIDIVENSKKHSFVLGRVGSDFSSSYISQAETDETYLVNIDLVSIFNREEWRDKQIFSFAKENVKSIRFQYPDREFSVARVNGAWQDVSEEKVNAILDAMSDMSASDIPEQSFENTGLEKNLIIVQVTGDEIDETLMIGDKQAGTDYYYAKRGNSDNIYLITTEEKEVLDLSLNDLL